MKNTQYNAIKAVIESGLGIAEGGNLTEDTFMIWLDYSRKILDIIYEKNFDVRIGYLQLLNEIALKNFTTQQKIIACLKFYQKLLDI